MSTLEERAEGLALWAKEASQDEVVEKVAELDRNALFWHVASMVLPRAELDRIEHLAAHLIANGYEQPAA